MGLQRPFATAAALTLTGSGSGSVEIRNLLNRHYTGHEGPMYDHLDIRGGAGATLWIVRRGLQARYDDFTVRRPPMRFTD